MIKMESSFGASLMLLCFVLSKDECLIYLNSESKRKVIDIAALLGKSTGLCFNELLSFVLMF